MNASRDTATPVSAIRATVDFLASQPSFDQVAMQLVVTLLSQHQPRAALISVFEQDGSLHAAGSFGLTDSAVLSLKKVSLWDECPMTEAVRSGQPLTILDTEALSAKYPQIRRQSELQLPTTVWPLALREQQVGAIEVLFSEKPDEVALERDLAMMMPILALYLGLTRTPAGGNQDHPSSITIRDISTTSEAAPKTSLTKRQLAILELMSRHMTNAQIANRIGYSESTIRQESIAIYRFLGADGRHQAVEMAKLRDLLPEGRDEESQEVPRTELVG